MSPNAQGAALSLAAFAVFAAHDVIVKWLGAFYSPVQIVFFSVLFGFPLVSLAMIRDATPGTLVPVHPWWVALRTLASVATMMGAFYAFATLPLAQVYAILFAAPLLITVLAVPILGEPVRLRRWIAVVVGLAGVLLVLRPGAIPLDWGHAAALLAACGSALASIIVRRIGREERSVVLLLYPLLTNCVLMGAILPFVYQPMPVLHLGGLALLAACAFCAASLVIAAYRKGEAVIVAPMQYSQILWAVLWGALLFDEYPDAMTLLGAGVVIASGVYILLRESGPASLNRPVTRSRLTLGTGAIWRDQRASRPREGE